MILHNFWTSTHRGEASPPLPPSGSATANTAVVTAALQVSHSLPGSPFAPHRLSRRRSSQFSWRRSPRLVGGSPAADGGAPWRPAACPMVMPCLDNLELPYADDSAAVTPTSEELCNFYNANFVLGANAPYG